MLKFYYNPAYKYTNRTIINVTGDTNYTEHNYENIDSPDTINGHIIYTLTTGEKIPTYVVDSDSGWRWFVSGITQLRTGKYQISLLRDIISESPNTWKTEQAYITAGTATNYNKYKRWNLPYTNTKINQQRLNINGKSSFFVFYVNEQHENSNVISETDLQTKYSSVPGITNFDYTVNGLSEIPQYQLIGAGPLTYWGRHKATIKMKSPPLAYIQWTYDSIYTNPGEDFTYTTSLDLNNYMDSTGVRWDLVEKNLGNSLTAFRAATENLIHTKESLIANQQVQSVQYNAISPYVNKIIHDTSTNKVYRLNLTSITQTYDQAFTSSEVSTYSSALRNIAFPMQSGGSPSFAVTGNPCTFQSECSILTYTLEELGTASTFDFTFKANVRKLPLSAVRCVNIVSDSNHSDSEIAQCLMLAQTNGINPDNTTGRILDIQYLPFKVATTTDANFKINNDSLIAETIDTDEFQYEINLTDLTNINKETDTIKIVSPSRASQFLFRPYDNGGNMEFTSKITLKPYTSTIYVRPSTKGLLMYDWDDKDCLIIQEDFSLTNVTSEWTQYVYQNKTYSSVFERQMQGREYERSWERQVEKAQALSDTWNARNVSAQKAQTYTGNLPIISGIAAAMGSAVIDNNYMAAAQMDRQYNEALYQEGMSLSRDLFEYQLENIKSQPLIPSKVTVIDCKFLDGVYLEFYSTNDTELNAISNFYKYNGNRIDDYGTFNTYWGPFVKGKIIISVNYTQPEIDELNRRLSMGIFTGGIL